MNNKPPTPNCNYIISEQIMFGWYPSPPDTSGIYSNNIDALISTERNVFVNLTTLDETSSLYDYKPYTKHHLPETLFLSYPIPDCGIPTDNDSFCKLIVKLYELIQKGMKLYIHCRGGHGRSGIVVGCLLINMGYNVEEVLKLLTMAHKTREYIPDYPCPQTQEQIQYIRDYKKSDTQQ